MSTSRRKPAVLAKTAGRSNRSSQRAAGAKKERRCEAVNHPAHYGGDVPHEVVKCLEAWGLERDALLWNAVKYIARSHLKGRQIEDLEKAIWYVGRRINKLREKEKEDGRN